MSEAAPLDRPEPGDPAGADVVDLAALHDRVTTGALARERLLPVLEPLGSLFPERGLTRGRVVSCRGAAAHTIADATIAAAMSGGAWAAVVDLPTFGADAAAELGVPLERLVRIEATAAGRSDERRLADWIDVMGAAVDGFDLVVATVPAVRGEWRPAPLRKLASRIRQRGAVVVTVGDAGVLASDLVLDTATTVWEGLGAGHGHLRRRRIEIEASGRRVAGRRTATIDVTASGRVVELAAAPDPVRDAESVDGQLVRDVG